MASALAKIFGTGKKGEPPSPQQAIQKLRETEEMLGKKTDFLEKKIEKEMQTVKKNGLKNKRGELCVVGRTGDLSTTCYTGMYYTRDHGDTG